MSRNRAAPGRMSKSRRGPNLQLKGLHTMSQAEKPNTTNPSRRALLAGAPAKLGCGRWELPVLPNKQKCQAPTDTSAPG
jgi:hypothetical protein